MPTKRNLSAESLEPREVFTGVPGAEGFDIYDTPVQHDEAAEHPSFFTVEIGEGRLTDASTPQDGAEIQVVRERLMAMVAAGDVNFDPEWIKSVLDTTVEGGAFATHHDSNKEGQSIYSGSPGGGLLGLINGRGDDYGYDAGPNAGLISSPLGLTRWQGCQEPSEARDRLMAMVASDNVNFDQIWIHSLFETMEAGASCGDWPSQYP